MRAPLASTSWIALFCLVLFLFIVNYVLLNIIPMRRRKKGRRKNNVLRHIALVMAEALVLTAILYSMSYFFRSTALCY